MKIMEKKYIKVPFDVEMAKRISNGEVDGKIVTRNGKIVRIICWDYKSMSGNYPILALVNQECQEVPTPYSEQGRYNVYGYVSEYCLNLMLEIPEYMTFKDGDIIKQSNDTCTWLSIIKDIDLSDDGKGGLLYFTNEYVSMLINDGDGSIDIDTYSDAGQKVERATEEEKLKLIDAMKANESPKAKEYLKRFFGIEQKQEYEFKPFDKVLVRQCSEDKWEAMLFSNYTDKIHKYRCCGMNYMHCIPYNDQTAHLLGTTDNWEETV